MVLLTYLVSALALALTAFLVFRVFVRRDYLRRGRLTLVSSSLESLIWGPFFAFPYIYNPKSWPAFWILDRELTRLVQHVGSALIVIGVLAVVAVMGSLGFRRSFGQAVNVLRTTGLYKVTRNPQIVVGSLIVLGVVLRWPSWYAAGWVFLFAVMVLTEEEHLRVVFGEAYVDYCRRVPRYLRLRKRRNGAAA